MSKRLFMDVHVLQTLPPSNINRDDTGSPKTAQYGGVRRARVSSQAWKRAMREYFRENRGEARVGVRTVELVKYIADHIRRLVPTYSEERALELSKEVVTHAGFKLKEDQLKALFFIGYHQAEALAKAALEGKAAKAYNKELREILKDNPEVDIALFGRMLAEENNKQLPLNEDASAQVAHAISTHAVQTEFDYYTALDDFKKEDTVGAGMLGNIEYNSSTLYRYANIALHELADQLASPEAAIEAAKLFVEAFANSLPTGKVNSFANQSLPQLLVVTLREDRPVNLVSAYEKPVKAGYDEGYVKASIEKLSEEFEKSRKFVREPLATYYISLEGECGLPGQEVENLEALSACLQKSLEEKISLKEV